MVILMTKRKQSLCQNKTGFDYQLNTITQKDFFSEKNAIYSAKMTLIPN